MSQPRNVAKWIRVKKKSFKYEIPGRIQWMRETEKEIAHMWNKCEKNAAHSEKYTCDVYTQVHLCWFAISSFNQMQYAKYVVFYFPFFSSVTRRCWVCFFVVAFFKNFILFVLGGYVIGMCECCCSNIFDLRCPSLLIGRFLLS